MFILVRNGERQGLCGRRRIFGLGEMNDKALARPHPLCGLAQSNPLLADPALLDQALQPAAGEFRKTICQDAVDAHSLVAGLHPDNPHETAVDGAGCGHLFRGLQTMPLRALKILVVVLGIMLVGGFAALIVAIAAKVAHRTVEPAAARHVAQAAIATMTTASDRLILDLVLPDGGHRIVLIDLASGALVGKIDLRPMP